ncbi:unnamed protein product [Clonostachys chloroleuca]|uniref:Aminotransferase class V domain-containing protein n=1 Tax=Clonostachys chloroleuca TaxID=1926264 RepID=A0AA35PYR1_9HYPO|nr:unnamed protein product [Clonostachys chloroleuca]
MTSTKFGKALKEQFLLAPGWRNMNNGSFGVVPRVIKDKQVEYQLQEESSPDKYIRYAQPKLLDASRQEIAKFVNAPSDTVILASNATTAVNIILRNLVWDQDGKDEILSFSTIYGACGKTISYICDYNELVSSRLIELQYPLEDEAIIEKFRAAIQASKAAGKRPKLACFDTVSSLPGVCFPYKELTKICREEGILSLVDGAQGVGMIPLDMTALDPDFFLSNCHKWINTPKGCAFMYIPVRNQSLLVSTMPTSHGYVPKTGKAFVNPLPIDPSKSAFIQKFQFVGTIDTSSLVCLKDSLEYRAKEFGTEEEIMNYLWTLAKQGGKKVAEILKTEIIENSKGTLTNCALVNVWLPVKVGTAATPAPGPNDVVLSEEESPKALAWAAQLLVEEYKTFVPFVLHNNQWFVRVSAQIYLELEDFEWLANVLKEVVERLRAGEFKIQS